MTKEEFESFIEEQKKNGLSEEEIAIVFSKMFQDSKLSREQYEACLATIGYGLSDEYKAMSDEELKGKVLSKADDDKGSEDGQQPPKAPEGGAAEDKGEDKEDKPEPKPEPKEEPEEEEEEEDEESQAMRLFGLKK